jgi:hypothetical protein
MTQYYGQAGSVTSRTYKMFGNSCAAYMSTGEGSVNIEKIKHHKLVIVVLHI